MSNKYTKQPLDWVPEMLNIKIGKLADFSSKGPWSTYKSNVNTSLFDKGITKVTAVLSALTINRI